MANPILTGISLAEQELLYNKLSVYNQGRASYKEAGAYLVVLPRPERPQHTLWIYSPLPERQAIFFICNLSENIHEALRVASTLCYYSPRCLYIVEYNAKRMQSKGDDIVSFGKYHGHFLHEVFSIDPAYLTWIAFKYTPRIPKQERFVQIARIYHSVWLDFQQRRNRSQRQSRYLGKEGDKVENLRLTITQVRIEDNPYRTHIKKDVPYFYVRQVLKLKDALGNLVTIHVNARTPSHVSGQLPATEHVYQPGETLYVESARIARTYLTGTTKTTRLNYVKFKDMP